MTKHDPDHRPKGYGESKNVTDEVKEKAGRSTKQPGNPLNGDPDPFSKDATPGWFAKLDDKLQAFINEVVDAAITEAARRFKETQTPPKDPESATYYSGMKREWVKAPESPAEPPKGDELGEALAGLLQAGKTVLKAFVNEVL